MLVLFLDGPMLSAPRSPVVRARSGMYDGTAALGDVVVKLPVLSGIVLDPAFVKELCRRHRARVLAVAGAH